MQTLEEMRQELYCKSTTYHTVIEVIPGGKQDGLDYGPVVVEIVVLDGDGDTIAYRLSTDSQDDDWAVGQIEDAIEVAQDYLMSAKN